MCLRCLNTGSGFFPFYFGLRMSHERHRFMWWRSRLFFSTLSHATLRNAETKACRELGSIFVISRRTYSGQSRVTLPVIQESRCLCCLVRVNASTRWRRWLRHYARSRNVAVSILDMVTETFDWPKLTGCTVSLSLTQPVTNEYLLYLMGLKTAGA